MGKSYASLDIYELTPKGPYSRTDKYQPPDDIYSDHNVVSLLYTIYI